MPKTGLEVAGANAWLQLPPMGPRPLVPLLRSSHPMKGRTFTKRECPPSKPLFTFHFFTLLLWSSEDGIDFEIR